jgi:hypothetical protein
MLYFNNLTMKKSPKTRCIHDQLLLLASILAQWWHPVDSREALDVLHRAICMVLYWRTTTAMEMASKGVHTFVIVLFAVALAAAGEMLSE